MKNTLTLVFVLFILCSCAQEDVGKAQNFLKSIATEDSILGQQRQFDEIPQKCASFGFKPNTPQFADCSMKLYQDAKNRQALKENVEAQRFQQPPPQPKSSFTCNTYGTRTTCN
jgi:hypothetical protein